MTSQHDAALTVGRRNTRAVAGLERLWLAAEAVAPPFVNQFVFEGAALPTAPRGGYDAVVDALVRQQPGCTVGLKGGLTWARWEAGVWRPRVVEVDGHGWGGRDNGGADFLRRRLDPRHGPGFEVLLVRGDPSRVIVRSHHSVTDGQGHLRFARGFFAALRGDEPERGEVGISDRELVARTRPSPPPNNCAAPTGDVDGSDLATTWRRTTVERPTTHRVLARLIIAIAQEIGPRGDDLRVDVPTNLRDGTVAADMGNLTGLVRLPVRPLLEDDSPLEAIHRDIRRRIDQGEARASLQAFEFARYLPLSLMGWLGRLSARRSLATGTFGTCAAVSNMGRLDLEPFRGGGFEAETVVVIPPGSPGLPLFVTLVGVGNRIELCAAAPAVLATRGRLDQMLGKLAEVLSQ